MGAEMPTPILVVDDDPKIVSLEVRDATGRD
jgi:hypothetical protein